jgi:hypothetical protein
VSELLTFLAGVGVILVTVAAVLAIPVAFDLILLAVEKVEDWIDRQHRGGDG